MLGRMCEIKLWNYAGQWKSKTDIVHKKFLNKFSNFNTPHQTKRQNPKTQNKDSDSPKYQADVTSFSLKAF